MSIACGTLETREIYESTHVYEYEVARRWYALPPGTLLPLNSGSSCQLLFAGRPGSAVGPDVRDVVLHFSQEEIHSVGDVEFHVRASDWFVHQHHTDARYNNVLLHVVLICDNTSPVLRQDGTSIPMCSLYDVPLSRSRLPLATWPCQSVMQRLSDEERTSLLLHAGLLRFEQKAHAFVEQLHTGSSQGSFNAYDVCLIVALAEGLGYGRDRAFFRAAGQYLLGLSNGLPEPLGRTFDPPSLDASRLSVLRKLIEQWRTTGAWETLKQAINLSPSHDSFPSGKDSRRGGGGAGLGGDLYGRPLGPLPPPLRELRIIFTGLGTARADILICNIVLPFAMAVALIENDPLLAQQAQMLYLEHPGLTSNRVTRAMCQQLQLAGEPEGACQQQGLHYIYQQTCREKRCELCIVGKRIYYDATRR